VDVIRSTQQENEKRIQTLNWKIRATNTTVTCSLVV